VASLGVLAYALGKFASGAVVDAIGGRRGFLSGMGLSVLCTVGFAVSGTLPLFTLAWVANRLVQSLGWVGMVKVTSRWFPHSAHARAMAVLSLSFLFGDAVARFGMGWLFSLGVGWRGVFLAAAGTLAAIFVVLARLLRESPGELGLPEPPASPESLFVRERGGSVLATLLRSRAFLWACAVSLGLTLLRETFNTWTPTYFVDALGLAKDDAASWSALFPGLGGVAVLAAGWLGDRVGRRGRALVIVGGTLAAAAVLLALGLGAGALGAAAGVALVAACGFLMLGPYSYLAGVVSLDFGGKRASATAAGVIDGVGYLGGILAGAGVARVVAHAGWDGAFALLAGVAVVTAACGALFAREL
jgi:OPA family glycerol-3-phosphate transporter-like MFS transporter